MQQSVYALRMTRLLGETAAFLQKSLEIPSPHKRGKKTNGVCGQTPDRPQFFLLRNFNFPSVGSQLVVGQVVQARLVLRTNGVVCIIRKCYLVFARIFEDGGT